MRVSKYIKADKNVLIEYIYDDNNNIGDPYKILVNFKDNSYSYVSGDSSVTNNLPSNQLFKIDGVTNNYGKVNTTNYTFLQYRDYSSGFPVRHDTIKIHLPVNYTFGEYIGCYVRVYTFGYDNKVTYDLSNFYFDMTDVDQSYLLNYTSPALLFQEKLWGKNISIDIPSTFAVANQRQNNGTKSNSINANLTNSVGLSLNSPIFIDFHFITSKKTVNKVTTYNLTAKTPMSLPQTPDFEKLGVKIQHSVNGDFFEIFGVYNDNIAEFKLFIDNSVQLGSRYYVEYTITLYEQNIRGKSFKIVVTNNFNEKIEYRPIIKYTTTTAIIDIEMNLIDAVNESSILRRASYGMLQDEVAKYSINLTKINISNASKPKIYNIKSPEGAGIFGRGNTRNKKSTSDVNLVTGVGTGVLSGVSATSSYTGAVSAGNGVSIEVVKVNYAVLSDRFNIVSKSDSVLLGKDNFYGIGKLQILLQPFDNIIQFIIAQDVSSEQRNVDSGNGSKVEYVKAPLYMDMTGMGEIKMIIKNTQLSVESTLYMTSNQVDLSRGVVVFKIPASKMNDVRKVHDTGVNLFYITSTTDSGTNVVYSGLFTIYDSKKNVADLNSNQSKIQSDLLNNKTSEAQIIVNDANKTGTAIVTRRIVQGNTQISATSSTAVSSSTSVESQTKIGGVTYKVSSISSLIIDGVEYSSDKLKKTIISTTEPFITVTNLTIRDKSLYTNGKFMGDLYEIKGKLEASLTTSELELAKLKTASYLQGSGFSSTAFTLK